jgi:two-component system, chemotaxis family, chemotaxis protein CheY
VTTAAAGSRRFLVVDDSASARLLIRLALEDWGRRSGVPVSVTEAPDAFEALRRLPRGAFDLVLTDVNMPALSGLELIRMIRAHPEQRGIPIVAISTEREPADAQRAREAGANGYLGKPFEAETLENLLGEILASRRGAG